MECTFDYYIFVNPLGWIGLEKIKDQLLHSKCLMLCLKDNTQAEPVGCSIIFEKSVLLVLLSVFDSLK
ncbi:hypothetical protein RchiOBHm_Chr6g0268751 [Rosa chinensis]|uniref:Uncharacterized protein n=1 Tax=Rosa chinensis TaxID=74649 RepID=A0A2P6PQ94_ROSCH|nr:hypothetical protein RchiOBHm_Chr6g0268751 [Rosa chinensis]